MLRFTEDANEALTALVKGGRATEAKLKRVRKALALLQQGPRCPGLNSHPYESFPGLPKGKVWDSYVENHVPSAWRVYWMYGPDETVDGKDVPVITVLAIRPHL
ncbi:hypothetical protein [Peterkaempfera bronchialis]|uniref:hypothetical protein n=1 Tax=Peterkaempfera bronchialis TaxID=2126346 RepID=UPI003C2EFC0F